MASVGGFHPIQGLMNMFQNMGKTPGNIPVNMLSGGEAQIGQPNQENLLMKLLQDKSFLSGVGQFAEGLGSPLGTVAKNLAQPSLLKEATNKLDQSKTGGLEHMLLGMQLAHAMLGMQGGQRQGQGQQPTQPVIQPAAQPQQTQQPAASTQPAPTGLATPIQMGPPAPMQPIGAGNSQPLDNPVYGGAPSGTYNMTPSMSMDWINTLLNNGRGMGNFPPARF